MSRYRGTQGLGLPERRWIGSGPNRRLVVGGVDSDDDVTIASSYLSSSVRRGRGTADETPRGGLQRWDDVQGSEKLHPSPKVLPKFARNRTPDTSNKGWRQRVEPQSSSIRRSRTADARLSTMSSFDPPARRGHSSLSAGGDRQGKTGPKKTQAWQARRTSPQPPQDEGMAYISGPEVDDASSSTRMAPWRKNISSNTSQVHATDAESGAYRRPTVSSFRRAQGPPSVASSRRGGYQPPEKTMGRIGPAKGPSSVASSRRSRTWADDINNNGAWAPPRPTAASPSREARSMTSSARRRWNRTWSHEMEESIRTAGDDIEPRDVGGTVEAAFEPNDRLRRVQPSAESNLIRRVEPSSWRQREATHSRPRSSFGARKDEDEMSLRSFGRESRQSRPRYSGELQVPRYSGNPGFQAPRYGDSVQGSLASRQSMKSRDYLSPAVPDRFAYTNETACSLVKESKQAKGVVVRARSPIRELEDDQGANFCDVCGAEYLRKQSQFCSECGSERVAVKWAGGAHM